LIDGAFSGSSRIKKVGLIYSTLLRLGVGKEYPSDHVSRIVILALYMTILDLSYFETRPRRRLKLLGEVPCNRLKTREK